MALNEGKRATGWTDKPLLRGMGDPGGGEEQRDDNEDTRGRGESKMISKNKGQFFYIIRWATWYK